MSDGGRRLLGAVGWVVPPESSCGVAAGMAGGALGSAADSTPVGRLGVRCGVAAVGELAQGVGWNGGALPGGAGRGGGRIVAPGPGGERRLDAGPGGCGGVRAQPVCGSAGGVCGVSLRLRGGTRKLGRGGSRWRRGGFLAAKLLLAMTVSCLLSADLCLPLRAVLPVTAAYAQMLCFVLAALVGQRWAFDDQERRCKQCLRALARPAEGGPGPSRNLLEWNGTELRCREGHGTAERAGDGDELVPGERVGGGVAGGAVGLLTAGLLR